MNAFEKKLYSFFLRVIGYQENNSFKNIRHETLKSLFRLFQIAIYAIIIIFVINLFNDKDSGFGVWGDFFGGVLNPILTFLTFMGLLITIILQQVELSESRKEFKRTADALNEQSLSIKKQNFEDTFFNMVSLLNENVANLEFEFERGRFSKGKSSFKFYHKELIDSIKKYKFNDSEVERYIKLGVDSFSFHNSQQLDHYFNQIKNLLKFIRSSKIENKKFYSNLLSGQLSMYEKGLIFHYAFSDKEYRVLIDRYNLLSGLNLKHFTYDPRIFNPYRSIKYE